MFAFIRISIFLYVHVIYVVLVNARYWRSILWVSSWLGAQRILEGAGSKQRRFFASSKVEFWLTKPYPVLLVIDVANPHAACRTVCPKKCPPRGRRAWATPRVESKNCTPWPATCAGKKVRAEGAPILGDMSKVHGRQHRMATPGLCLFSSPAKFPRRIDNDPPPPEITFGTHWDRSGPQLWFPHARGNSTPHLDGLPPGHVFFCIYLYVIMLFFESFLSHGPPH